jgi:hypothetical protein
MSSASTPAPRTRDGNTRPVLHIVVAPPTAGASSGGEDEEAIDVRLSFGQLVLIHKSLLAAKILRGLKSQDELLDDTIKVVDLALEDMRKRPANRSADHPRDVQTSAGRTLSDTRRATSRTPRSNSSIT